MFVDNVLRVGSPVTWGDKGLSLSPIVPGPAATTPVIEEDNMTLLRTPRGWARVARIGATLALAVIAAVSVTAGAQAATKLQFWDMIWGPAEYSDAAQKIVADFNSSHPDIQVEYRSVPWNNWYQTFQTAVSSGSAPDLSTGAGYQAVQLYKQGAISPLDDLIASMTSDGDIKNFAPGTVDVLRYDSHYVALPWGLDIRVWYYRPSLLKAAGVAVPTTWDEFRAAAKTLTKDGKFGVVASGDTGGSHYLYAAMLNNGGGMFDKDGKLAFTSNPRNVEAISWLSDLVKDGSVNPGSAGFSSDDKVASFFKGDDAFMLDTPGVYNSSAAPKDDVAVLPPLKGPHGDMGTVFWVNNIMMYQQTQHPKETEAFMEWWSQHELPLWTEGHTGQIPARTTFVKDAAAGDARYQTIVDTYIPVGKTTATGFPGIFPQLSDIEGEGVMQTLAQQIWQGADPKQAMDQAETTMNDIMSK